MRSLRDHSTRDGRNDPHTQHLIGLGEWDEERHVALEKELNELVIKSYKEAETHGTLHDGPLSPVESIFEDGYAEQDWRLRRQRQDLGV